MEIFDGTWIRYCRRIMCCNDGVADALKVLQGRLEAL